MRARLASQVKRMLDGRLRRKYISNIEMTLAALYVAFSVASGIMVGEGSAVWTL